MSLKQDIMAALTSANLAPLHRFGQNFMIDAAAVASIVQALGVTVGDRVVEVGPGTGVLTERMLALGARVTAVEIDRGLHGYLEQRFADEIKAQVLSLVHGDCLENKNTLHPEIIAVAAAGPWRLGANLPYDVALPVLLNAAALPQPPTLVVVTVQWEAAERLCSRPGSAAWGASAATMQAAGAPTMVRKLPPDCFYPRPRVDSAILRWEPRAPLPAGFGRWCRILGLLCLQLLLALLVLHRRLVHRIVAWEFCTGGVLGRCPTCCPHTERGTAKQSCFQATLCGELSKSVQHRRLQCHTARGTADCP